MLFRSAKLVRTCLDTGAALLTLDTNLAKAAALAGVRVIDLTQVVLGPMGTQILGDAGADIIKIEPPAGDMTRFVGPRRSDDMAAV